MYRIDSVWLLQVDESAAALALCRSSLLTLEEKSESLADMMAETIELATAERPYTRWVTWQGRFTMGPGCHSLLFRCQHKCRCFFEVAFSTRMLDNFRIGWISGVVTLFGAMSKPCLLACEAEGRYKESSLYLTLPFRMPHDPMHVLQICLLPSPVCSLAGSHRLLVILRHSLTRRGQR